MKKLQCEFILPSGVPVKAYQLYGEQHEILTAAEYEDEHRMVLLIQSLAITIGSIKIGDDEQGKKFITSLRAMDKRAFLANVRQATMQYEKLFKFTHKWVDSNGDNKDSPQEVKLNDVEAYNWIEHIDYLAKTFGSTEEDITFYKEINKDGTFKCFPSSDRALEYSELETYYELTLPICKEVVRLEHLTWKGETFIAKFPSKKLNTNTLISARYPKYKSGDAWVNVNPAKLHGLDLAHIKTEMKKREGSVSMELRFDNPNKKSKDKIVTIDLIQETAFFFPSEVLG